MTTETYDTAAAAMLPSPSTAALLSPQHATCTTRAVRTKYASFVGDSPGHYPHLPLSDFMEVNAVSFLTPDESRPEQCFDADPAPRGRCNLRTDLTLEDAHVANAVLARFGADETQLPYFGDGNCHNWAAGAVASLETAGLAAPGDGERWAAMIGKGPLAMERGWTEDAGRQWVPCEKFLKQVRPGVVDAKWGDADGKGDSALVGGAESRGFKNRARGLEKLLGGKQG
ncbi:Uu.00g007260.m01.CDS01 [Anthostomella pinea]|uniref:Uu.00g007260.m01.CDS01 n=1 Tax=Anthostomella pinea TaxID=933095 RepID=A0AAI8VWX5_9PEZI|nr:Uu.00g007260.m01.CDS01 [Anthostomella pinea]